MRKNQIREKWEEKQKEIKTELENIGLHIKADLWQVICYFLKQDKLGFQFPL